MGSKKIFLVAGFAPRRIAQDIRSYVTAPPHSLEMLLLHARTPEKITEGMRKNTELFEHVVYCDPADDTAVAKALAPFRDRLAGAIAYLELNQSLFEQVLPHLPPAVLAPTPDAVRAANDKILMRERFRAYAPDITPRFIEVSAADETTIHRITAELAFPVIVKPRGLASSLLIEKVTDPRAIQSVVAKQLARLSEYLTNSKYKHKPELVVEEFLSGETYTADGYVDADGTLVLCPLVRMIPATEKGYDDFFSYMTVTPVDPPLAEADVAAAHAAMQKGVHAVGLTNVTAMFDLIRTEDGWKLLEIGARAGGYRDVQYQLSFGFNHNLNSARIKLGETPALSHQPIGHTAIFKLYAKTAGTLSAIHGLETVRSLPSFHSSKEKFVLGTPVRPNRDGGESLLHIVLFNEDRAALERDMRTCEESIVIEVA